MPEIRTRDVVNRTIRTLDKAGIAEERIRDLADRAKELSDRMPDSPAISDSGTGVGQGGGSGQGSSPSSYAVDQTQEGFHKALLDAPRNAVREAARAGRDIQSIRENRDIKTEKSGDLSQSTGQEAHGPAESDQRPYGTEASYRTEPADAAYRGEAGQRQAAWKKATEEKIRTKDFQERAAARTGAGTSEGYTEPLSSLSYETQSGGWTEGGQKEWLPEKPDAGTTGRGRENSIRLKDIGIREKTSAPGEGRQFAGKTIRQAGAKKGTSFTEQTASQMKRSAQNRLRQKARQSGMRAVRARTLSAKVGIAKAGKAIQKAAKSLSNIIKVVSAGVSVIGIAIALICMLGGGFLLFYNREPTQGTFGAQLPLSAEVLELTPLIVQYCGEQGISEYVPLVQAVMMQETGGKYQQYPDVMQCSEGCGWQPNTITDPEYSIMRGVGFLKGDLQAAGVQSPLDIEHIKLALQGYNFGGGYISYAQSNGGYNIENARAYSVSVLNGGGCPGYPEYVLRYYSYSGPEGGGPVSFPPNGMPIPYYNQGNYASVTYGDSNLANCGCGPTAFAMVASYLSGSTITPADAVAWCGNSYYVYGSGTGWGYFSAAASHFGIGSVVQTGVPNAVLQALSEGHPVISSQKPGLFTRAGHFIVLRGISEGGRILVNDPNDSATKNYINRSFDFWSEIDSTSASYWIFYGG